MTTPHETVRERVADLPDAVRDCERCGGDDAMQLRRSSLNDTFLADDVVLKCKRCRYAATHGIPFDDPETFEWELMDLRNGTRTLDFALDGPSNDVADNLAALGYTAAATQH